MAARENHVKIAKIAVCAVKIGLRRAIHDTLNVHRTLSMAASNPTIMRGSGVDAKASWEKAPFSVAS